MRLALSTAFNPDSDAVLVNGDCLKLLGQIPDQTIQLVFTSPPYNVGKSYEKKKSISAYLEWQSEVIRECHRVLLPEGSICWQVGNYVESGSIVPIDILLHPVFGRLGMRMRNRIIWHFEHGLHCSRRLSGRYETIMWYTKNDSYHFELDSIRVPQKYPGKRYFKGPRSGELSCNPLGKNPGDVWVIPNVKNNHVEKTDHPCQFPIELVQRMILSLAPRDSWVLDPFSGVGTTVAAAICCGRRGAGAEIIEKYHNTALSRVLGAAKGVLPLRPMNKPVYDPAKAGKKIRSAPWLIPEASKPETPMLDFPFLNERNEKAI